MPHTLLAMIVDDHEDSREMYAVFLASAGFEVCTAASAEEALGLAHQRSPAVIVADVRLPGASGLDLAHQLRSDDRTSNMAIFLLTGDVDARERGADVDADRILMKPFPPDALVVQIVAALAQRANTVDGPRHPPA